MAKTLASKTQTPRNACTRLRASRIGLGSCRTVGEWPTPVPLASLPGCYWRGSLRSSGSVVNPLRALTGLPGQNAGTLFLMGGRPGRSECGRSDGDAARMADDRVLPPLIADKTGAAGTAEQGCQGYAREFCHGWFHNIIPAFRPADGMTAAVLSRIARFSRSRSIKWMETDSRESRLRRLPLVTAQQCLADGVGAGRQRTRLRFRWLPPSAVQTRIDDDGQAGIQIYSPFQHQGPLAFVAGFHIRTLTRACRPDHRSEVLFGRAKGLLRPKAYGPFGPPL